MPLSNLALLGLGLGTVVVVVVATKKPASRKRHKKPTGPDDFKAPDPPAQAHPICRKYPGGYWHPGGGYLKGFPDGKGWSDADTAMAVAAVDEATATIPAWTTITQARNTAFEIVRSIISSWCSPKMKLPKMRITLEAYLKKSVALTWMWMALEPMVWARVIDTKPPGPQFS